nr:adenylyltransferase/cytidyltransferase family protein [Ardenticatenales bacterium]
MTKAIYPGTFDPITYGQIDIAHRATELFDEVVIAVYARPTKNELFPIEERLAMVRETFKDQPLISVAEYDGLTVDFARAVEAKVIV